jgi:hypothetical protein
MAEMIEIATKEDMVTCASCKHCQIGLVNLIFGGRQFAKCKRTEQITVEYDPVTGKIRKKVKIEYCSTQRGDYSGYTGECGPQGKHWVPKHTRDVFKALRKI